ncbi:MAG: DNA mismatch repair endonuclease MutL [Treponema sp.]|nr:DNA mismatch repair endonuclease MutL [Treponema sp.]
MPQNNSERQIKILNAETARKIAAGEVIDRPNAIVREMLDNAVDSGASQIDVEIQNGGIDRIRVQDNGCGMSRENLLLAAHPHATSKISSDTDLLNLTTLGFRGEALASIAAVSRLSIASGEWKMRCSITEDHVLEPCAAVEGTIVCSENLFENFPARRQFLKRPASETKMCRQTFLEKAMPRPDIAFRLTVDGQIRNDFRAQSLKERFQAALDIKQSPDLFYEIKGKGNGFSFSLVIGDPCIARQDRKDIYIFVNGRRIAEYSLVQAIEYGAQGYFPNGTHPAAALYAQVQPDLVDFNIHPAKKEARFKDIASLHHGVSSSLKEFFRALTIKQMKGGFESQRDLPKNDFNQSDCPQSPYERISSLADLAGTEEKPSQTWQKAQSFESQRSASYSSPYANSSYGAGRAPRITERSPSVKVASPAPNESQAFSGAPGFFSEDFARDNFSAKASLFEKKPFAEQESFRYIGRALGVFIIIEKNKSLYFVDQHAAHERLLFDKLMEGQNQRQSLLVPEKIELDSEEDDRYMESIADELRRFGFECQKSGDCVWTFTSINSMWKGGIIELKKLIFEKRIEPKELIRKIAAMASCRSAVKDGDVLDDAAAEDLAKKAFELPDPHCPHGRPCWTVITKEKFFELVKRT